MSVTDWISLLLLLLFVFSYIFKILWVKKRNNIKVDVLAKGSKDFSLFRIELLVRISSSLWVVTWIFEILYHSQISTIVDSFFSNSYISFLGLGLTVLGVCLFISAVIYMKNSWRVGIDKQTKTTLITDGIYQVSRNPAFVGFYFMFLGSFVSYANLWTLFVLLLNVIVFHLLVLQEEKHLLLMFGEEYMSYKQKVPRYY
ncbi:MAG: isoprenylcysteine carboxylmethyltransferase family protein [Gorillibacterium sp.]|nr:isoprenylcysteine carboxylmethyltransferase family protein [Gorillibacterium sp.]